MYNIYNIYNYVIHILYIYRTVTEITYFLNISDIYIYIYIYIYTLRYSDFYVNLHLLCIVPPSSMKGLFFPKRAT